MKARELQSKKDEILICKDRGIHEYMPVSWIISKAGKHVSKLLCMRCFKCTDIDEARHIFSQPVE